MNIKLDLRLNFEIIYKKYKNLDFFISIHV